MTNILENINIPIEELVGHKGNLYYCNELNQFQLGTVMFEVMEDEGDGYRSAMERVAVISVDAPLKQHIAEVQICQSGSDDGIYELRDTKDDFVWLEFGTDTISDSYYPSFVFRTFVKKGNEHQINQENQRKEILNQIKEKIKS